MEAPRDGMATVFSSGSYSAEIEAQTIRGMLETNGIEAFVTGIDVLSGAYAIPGKEVLVQVAVEQKDEAERVIVAAREAGPAAASEAELASEGHLRPDV